VSLTKDNGIDLTFVDAQQKQENQIKALRDFVDQGVDVSDDFADASQWASQAGSWAVTDGEYRQTSTSVTDARSIITDAYARDWESYTLELDARKLAGSEGFLVGFAAEGANDYFWWNLGGWNNSRTVLQKADGGSAGEVKAVEGHTIETGQTYRLKVVVEGRDIQLFIDGELQMEYTDAVPTLDTYRWSRATPTPVSSSSRWSTPPARPAAPR